MVSQSKITFLGVGGGRVVLASQVKSTAGFVINLGDRQIFVDPGPGALTRAHDFKVKADKTDIVFVTHAHLDHANDLNAVVAAMTLSGVHKRGIVISTPSVLDGYDGNPAWLHPKFKDYLNNIYSIQPRGDVEIENIKFIATKTKHDEEQAIGLKLEAQGITIGYTGDTTYFKELNKEFKGCDVLIMNVLRPGDEKWNTHFNSDNAVKLIESVRPELAIIRHYGLKMIKANPLYEAREIQRRSGVRTLAVDDGTVVDLSRLISQKKSMV